MGVFDPVTKKYVHPTSERKFEMSSPDMPGRATASALSETIRQPGPPPAPRPSSFGERLDTLTGGIYDLAHSGHAILDKHFGSAPRSNFAEEVTDTPEGGYLQIEDRTERIHNVLSALIQRLNQL